jgi:type II secretory pathway component GspD/PulD (secretin)
MSLLRKMLSGCPKYRLAAAFVAAAWSTSCMASIAAAQTLSVQGGGAVPVSPEAAKAMIKAQRHGAKPPEQPPAQPAQPPAEAKPDDKDKKKEGEGEKKDDASVVKRPDKPPRVPAPGEFKVKLDAQGRVPPFNFVGQPWPDVMQWLADLSKCSLDWQELPGGYLNLTTQRSYTLDEVRDLINRHLNARGFISIQSGEVISVFKLDKIDPSVVRRVEEDKLYDLKPYDFVKVSFELPSGMEVDKAKDDVKQVLSPTAKVYPLVASKRLLIMDSVANLRGVSELFNNERMVQDGRIVPKEYVLKYARPQQVIEILYLLLGVDPKAKPTQTDPQAQQQQMAMIQQMQQQGRGAEAAKMMQKGDAPKVYLAFNRQRNSVLVNAPPEQLKIVEQTIKFLDVPYGDASSATNATGSNETTRMQRYSLVTLDPDKFVSTLEDIGGLSPYAQFKVDDNSKTLFAFATESDHKKIAALIQDFDGSGRHFKVIQLRKNQADLVAATIYTMMAGQNEKKDDNRRRYWDWYDYDGGRDRDKKKDTIQGFGVDANIESNQLLLWATDIELKRVNEFLTELGETPQGQSDQRRVRMVEQTGEKPTARLLKELSDAWAASGGNKLIIKAPPESKKPPADENQEKSDKDKSDKQTQPAKDRAARTDRTAPIVARFVQLGATAVVSPDANPPKQNDVSPAHPSNTEKNTDSASEPAPVTITVTPDGKLMLSSSDTAALDRLEDLIEKLSPPQRRFKVYQIKYIGAFDMYLDLKNFFKEDMEKESSGFTRDWYGFMVPKGGDEKNATGLAKRRKLMLDWDPPSNSIIVANASESQLAEVEQMIAEFDKPPRKDSVEKRTTKAVKIKYSKPSVIAAAVKEVYRDLLSSRDKEFAAGEQKDKKNSAERVTVINYGGGGDSGSDDQRSSSIKVGFDGALSLGADDVSGVLIVSAQQGIFNDIERMVHELDEEAAPKTTVQVHQISGQVSAEALQKALDKAVGKAWLGNRPEQQPNQTGSDAEQKKKEAERNRNDKNKDNEHHESR